MVPDDVYDRMCAVMFKTSVGNSDHGCETPHGWVCRGDKAALFAALNEAERAGYKLVKVE